MPGPIGHIAAASDRIHCDRRGHHMRSLYMHIWSLTDKRCVPVEVSGRQLVEGMRFHRRSVNEALIGLEEIGLVTVERPLGRAPVATLTDPNSWPGGGAESVPPSGRRVAPNRCQ